MSHDSDYVKAIEAFSAHFAAEIKEKGLGRFYLENGSLTHVGGFHLLHEDIGRYQKWINEFLGQKEYSGEYTAYEKTYARSEDEAHEFLRYYRPKSSLSKITEIT